MEKHSRWNKNNLPEHAPGITAKIIIATE